MVDVRRATITEVASHPHAWCARFRLSDRGSVGAGGSIRPGCLAYDLADEDHTRPQRRHHRGAQGASSGALEDGGDRARHPPIPDSQRGRAAQGARRHVRDRGRLRRPSRRGPAHVIVVADSSVWVSYLRTGTKGSGGALDGLLAGEQIRMCGPVAAELLVGTPAAHRAELWTLLAGLPLADLGGEQWREV